MGLEVGTGSGQWLLAPEEGVLRGSRITRSLELDLPREA